MAKAGGRWKRWVSALVLLAAALTITLSLTVFSPASGQPLSIQFGGKGPYTVIASGTRSGHSWRIVAFQREDGAPCVGTNDDVLGGGSACFPDVPMTNLVNADNSVGPDLAFVAGPVAVNVNKVVVTFPTHSVTLVPRQVLGQSLRFFALAYSMASCTSLTPEHVSVEALGHRAGSTAEVILQVNSSLFTSGSC